jgi:anaphase-promoting complex subunit 2
MAYCVGTWTRVSVFDLCTIWSLRSTYTRFGHQVLSAFNHAFQTHVFSVLPASFSSGFKSLIEMTLQPYIDTEEQGSRSKEHPADLRLWAAFECLGMLERYESLISSVCYEAIEKHVWDKCAKSWAEPELANLREWMTDCIVPWMLLPYARGARNCMGINVVQRPRAD